jgi:hypothetical protein
MPYWFHFFYAGGGGAPARERHDCEDDPAARVLAARQLLKQPSRHGVEVWRGSRLVYARWRGRRPAPREPDAA